MLDGPGCSFKGVGSKKRTEPVSKADTERHGIIHTTARHEKERLLEPVGAKGI